MAAPKSRNTRMSLVPGGASKYLRYVHTCSQAAGSQFCQDRGATVCGRVTVTNALSSKPGRLLSADAGPNSQLASNEAVAPEGPFAMPVAAPASHLAEGAAPRSPHANSHAASPAVPPSTACKNQRRPTCMGWRASLFPSPIGRSSTQRLASVNSAYTLVRAPSQPISEVLRSTLSRKQYGVLLTHLPRIASPW